MILFDSWEDIARLLAVGAMAYFGLILFLRVSGNRTLSKLNAFDLVVTVALGSTLATVLLSSTVSLSEGLAAFALLIGLQYAIAWTSARSSTVSKLVRAEPRLLVFEGRLLESAMRRERVTTSEIMQSLRSSGVGGLDEAKAVVLEADGSLSVLTSTGQRPTTGGVAMPDDHAVR